MLRSGTPPERLRRHQWDGSSARDEPGGRRRFSSVEGGTKLRHGGRRCQELRRQALGRGDLKRGRRGRVRTGCCCCSNSGAGGPEQRDKLRSLVPVPADEALLQARVQATWGSPAARRPGGADGTPRGPRRLVERGAGSGSRRRLSSTPARRVSPRHQK